MRIHIASDHAGFDVKTHAIDFLKKMGHDVIDHGALTFDPLDDYVHPCVDAARALRDDPGSLGIVIGGSGNGEQMAANLVDGVRCALVWSEETARLARQHNDANCMAVGARMHKEEDALALMKVFIDEPFSGDERHMRRIAQMAEYEKQRQRA